MRVHGHEQVHRAVPAILVIDALELAGRGRDGLAHLANQLKRALVEAHHRARRVERLGVEIEHVLHARDVLAVDLRHAPHLLAPGLELVLGQAPAHGFTRDAIVLGEAHHLAGEQFDGPASAALGRAGARGRNQKSFLLAGELALGAGTGLFMQGFLESALHEVALGPVDGGAADTEALGNGLVRHPGVAPPAGYELA